jgi:hypothetical protein
MSPIGQLDVVRLKEAVGPWPAGTEGTVVEVYDDGALVEIANADGETLDMVSALYGALKLAKRHTAPAHD